MSALLPFVEPSPTASVRSPVPLLPIGCGLLPRASAAPARKNSLCQGRARPRFRGDWRGHSAPPLWQRSRYTVRSLTPRRWAAPSRVIRPARMSGRIRSHSPLTFRGRPASTARAGDEIRLSSDGKENPAELSRVRTTIADLPAVEVVRLGGQPQRATLIRHAALVGWMNDEEILVAQDEQLAVYDLRGRVQREIPIRVRTAGDAFLR
jgi:hypothetical protein